MVGNAEVTPDGLLSAARSGDRESLGRLLQLYSSYLNLFAAARIRDDLRCKFSPSDVVQETFFQAHRDFEQFRGQTEREFVAWLRQILVNSLARLVRRHVLAEKRDFRREVSLNRLGDSVGRSARRLESALIDRGASPSADARRRETDRILADRLAELPDEYRQVLVLRHVEGLPFEEVANQMNRSSGAVRMLWLRAIRQLRQTLHGRDEDESRV